MQNPRNVMSPDSSVGSSHGLHPFFGGTPDAPLRTLCFGRHEHQAVGLGEAMGLHPGEIRSGRRDPVSDLDMKRCVQDWVDTSCARNDGRCDAPVRQAVRVSTLDGHEILRLVYLLRVSTYGFHPCFRSLNVLCVYVRVLFLVASVYPRLMIIYNLALLQVFEGHSHYVMMVKFNLKDSNTFASASLDRFVRLVRGW